MLNFVMIVEDAGELKTVTADEFIAALQDRIGVRTDAEKLVDDALNQVLDVRAAAAASEDADEQAALDAADADKHGY